MVSDSDPQRLSDAEIDQFDAFAKRLSADDAAALKAQLQTCTVTHTDEMRTTVIVPADAPLLQDIRLHTLAGSYVDSDGGRVNVMLHFSIPPRRIAWIHRYRPDGRPIANTQPLSKHIEVHDSVRLIVWIVKPTKDAKRAARPILSSLC
jgi:hypothetical protein